MLRRFEASPSRCPRLMGMASSGRERGALAIVQVRCRRIFLVAASSGEGLLAERRTAAQPWRRGLAFMHRSGRSRGRSGVGIIADQTDRRVAGWAEWTDALDVWEGK